MFFLALVIVCKISNKKSMPRTKSNFSSSFFSNDGEKENQERKMHSGT